MKKALLIFVGTTLFFPMISAAEIYKWVDKNGKTHYESSPPPDEQTQKKTESITILGNGTSVSKKEMNNNNEPKKETVVDDSKKADTKLSDEEDKRKKEVAEVRAFNCKLVLDSIKTLSSGGRVSRVDEKGTTVLLDDKQMAKDLEQARAEQGKWCD